jgi:ketosteroid isomerase-like protein
VIEQFDDANARMLDGDCGLWKQLMSHRRDVTLLGAYGGHVRGWDEVSARFDRTAAGYAGGGGTTARHNISTWIGADLACVVDLEEHRTRLDQHDDPTVFVYRTTHLLRREAEGWAVVLRHADPIATFRGPEAAHTPQ